MAHFEMENGVLVTATIGAGETSVTLPAGCTSVGYCAFHGCSGLTSVTLPAGCTTVGDSAFKGCSGLTYITIPAGCTSVGDSAFQECSGLTSIILVHPCDSAPVFVAWAVGASRSRTNWRLTPVHTSRNVVRLIVDYYGPRRETFTCLEEMDRCDMKWDCDSVFAGCTRLGVQDVEDLTMSEEHGEKDEEDED